MADQAPGPAKPFCVVCYAFRNDLLDCTQCRQIKYCSKKCQRADWKIHKTLCSSVALFKDENRPSSMHFRAIVFPEHGSQPRFEWLHRDLTSLPAEFVDVNGHYLAGQNHRLWHPLEDYMLLASRTRTRADGTLEAYGEPN